MVADYSTVLDAEAWAYIDKVNSFYPPEAINWPIKRNRAVYNEMCQVFHAGRPDGVKVTTTGFTADSRMIPIRIYAPAAEAAETVLLYFHGGGFILGNLDSHDDICAEMSHRTGRMVVSVDYRLAPEHLHPAAFDDAVAAFDWVSRRFARPIILTGESAGGNLAAAVAHARRIAEHPPHGQVLIYPALGGDPAKGSYLTHAKAPLLSTADVIAYGSLRTGGAAIVRDPRLNPLDDDDFSNLPPTVVFTAECDPLASDGVNYCSAITAAGGNASCHEEKGLMHGYLRARRMVEKADESFTRIIEALSTLSADSSGENSHMEAAQRCPRIPEEPCASAAICRRAAGLASESGGAKVGHGSGGILQPRAE